MLRITLKRVTYTERYTVGIVEHEGEPVCLMLEPPQRGNARNISCIPAGFYLCRLRQGRTPHRWDVLDVPGRDFIQIHVGNRIADTRGCPLPGLGIGIFGGEVGVSNSTAALNKIFDIVGAADFWLRVTDR